MKTSFDSMLPDGSSVTAESLGNGYWALYLYGADGSSQKPLGRVSGSRDEAMIKADAIADAIAQDRTVNS